MFCPDILFHSCLERLENASLLRAWGKVQNRNELTVVNGGPELLSLHQLNPDILFPLAKTYTELVEGDLARLVSSIRFTKESNVRLEEGAQLAAKLMYESSK